MALVILRPMRKLSINAQRNLMATGRNLNQSIERLSSGLKVNSASDDAAGMAVTDNLRAQIRGFEQAIENATMESRFFKRRRARTTRYPTFDSFVSWRCSLRTTVDEQGTSVYLDTEFEDLTDEITRISNVAEYNGVPLLDGTAGDGAGNMVFQVGTRNTLNDQITINRRSTVPQRWVSMFSMSPLGTAQGAITAIDLTALDTLATDRAELGSKINEDDCSGG